MKSLNLQVTTFCEFSDFRDNQNLWAPLTCDYATLQQSVANLTFHNISFNFATAISKFTPSLSYHIVCKRIAKVTDFLSFCPFGIVYSLFSLSELVCTKNVFYPILLFHTYLPQADSLLERYGRTDFNTPFTLSFFHWAHGALPAGATLLGWRKYGVDGRLNKKRPNTEKKRDSYLPKRYSVMYRTILFPHWGCERILLYLSSFY